MVTTLYIGLQKTRDGLDIEATEANRTLAQIKRAAAQRFGGYTCAIAFGGWLNPTGELVEEMAARLEIISDESVREFACWAGRLLEQSCVGITEVGANHFYQGFLQVDESVELLDAANRNTELANAA